MMKQSRDVSLRKFLFARGSWWKFLLAAVVSFFFGSGYLFLTTQPNSDKVFWVGAIIFLALCSCCLFIIIHQMLVLMTGQPVLRNDDIGCLIQALGRGMQSVLVSLPSLVKLSGYQVDRNIVRVTGILGDSDLEIIVPFKLDCQLSTVDSGRDQSEIEFNFLKLHPELWIGTTDLARFGHLIRHNQRIDGVWSVVDQAEHPANSGFDEVLDRLLSLAGPGEFTMNLIQTVIKGKAYIGFFFTQGTPTGILTAVSAVEETFRDQFCFGMAPAGVLLSREPEAFTASAVSKELAEHQQLIVCCIPCEAQDQTGDSGGGITADQLETPTDQGMSLVTDRKQGEEAARLAA